MTVAEFMAKWGKAELKERSAAQEHFLDLCGLLGHPTPAEADPTGESFCFEKDAAKHGGGDGFADVWKKGFFAWEYKGKHKDLSAAHDQLLLYRDALASPPLLVACDLDRIVVHTNFTNTVSVRHEIPLAQLGEPRSLEILRAVFFEPDLLRPGRTSEAVTQEAAEHFADIAEAMRRRGLDPAFVAHFLNRLVFCLFAEDIGLLPGQLFTRIVEKSGGDAAKFARLLAQLFEAMRTGGDFGLETIRHFNGNLFDDAAVPPLVTDDIKRIGMTVRLDWSAVDPSIFGTLFERGLDPAKRSQLGAHYTSRADIEELVDIVVMTPLRREWLEARTTAASLLATGRKDQPATAPAKALSSATLKKARAEADSIVHRFLTRLHAVRVLDPACGSGNFLYVTLQKLKDLEKDVILFAMENGLSGYLPMVGPWQLHGIEINPYAHDLAQTAVWIGFLQWTRANGFQIVQSPVLRTMTGNFQCRDAILDAGIGDPASTEPVEPVWPAVDFIVGNPPFLGGKKLRRELGDAYVDRLLPLWNDRVPAEADLCCYWFEKARAQLADGRCKRAGLLATQGIRGGANREVLRRIKESGGIFWGVSDRDWILDGANVHVSMVGFDNGEEKARLLDGRSVSVIHANLSSAADTTQAETLMANAGLAFMGDTKVGPFDIPEALALAWLPLRNPHGCPNSDVVRPWANGLEITRAPQKLWIVDFPPGMDERTAAKYEAPFEYIREHVKPMRATNKRKVYAERWWIHAEARPDLRAALKGLPRFLVTPCVAKHRIFAWLDAAVLPDHQLIAFARSDDFFLGILHARVHEVWARSQGTQVRERESGFRYTPTSCFETFPFPTAEIPPMPSAEKCESDSFRDLNVVKIDDWFMAKEPSADYVTHYNQVAAAAGALNQARSNWLGDRSDPSRTLTALYNKRPQWLVDAHAVLDSAVSMAYGWPDNPSDDEILSRLLALNRQRSAQRKIGNADGGARF